MKVEEKPFPGDRIHRIATFLPVSIAQCSGRLQTQVCPVHQVEVDRNHFLRIPQKNLNIISKYRLQAAEAEVADSQLFKQLTAIIDQINAVLGEQDLTRGKWQVGECISAVGTQGRRSVTKVFRCFLDAVNPGGVCSPVRQGCAGRQRPA